MLNQYTAKTQSEAIARACVEKNCLEEELIFRLISEEKHFLGIGNSATIEAYTRNDVKEFIFDYLGSYFQSLDLGVSIEIILQERDSYNVVLDSEKNAILIGRGGQTLRAIATVLRAAVNTEFKVSSFHRPVRLSVDINDYRKDRYQKITAIARRVAKEVAKSHIDAALDPMPNDERKMIHQVISSFPHVVSESRGEGRERHVVLRYVEEKGNAEKTPN